ncbi:uncharacterized protein LOC130630115 [Hydractinia symbiolongicarpus]|uniref:uncharacterized protein LOC130630115 n=1 Tax=Hydractinia symbiolongicarpus TaxID=13093 RepID=UPI00254AF39A|nr:uncharacterized protein LOC130630115 [Hydractinia symbiolongicarpus]
MTTVCGHFKFSRLTACSEFLLLGRNVLAVLPTGFGKSPIHKLLPYFLLAKDEKNIVIVISPLNSSATNKKYDSKGTNRISRITKIFVFSRENRYVRKKYKSIYINTPIINGRFEFLFAHPKPLLSFDDKAHCMELWCKISISFFKEAVKHYLSPSLTPVVDTFRKHYLSMFKGAVVKVSPNRRNIFLDVKIRTQSFCGLPSRYEQIFRSIAFELGRQHRNYPMNVIYSHLAMHPSMYPAD